MRPSKRVSRPRGRGCSSAGRRGRSRRATTRRSPPGTGWRSGRSPTRGGSSGVRDLTAAATRAAEAITGGLLAADGSLGRSWKDGRATGQGVLEDYAHLADGLLALYEATFDERWFTTARALMDRVLARFADPGRRLLRHRRRPRAARGAAEGRAGQRRPVRERDGDAGAAAAGGVDRRGPLSRCRGARDADGDGVRGALPDRVRPVALGDGPRAGTGASRSRSSATRRTRRRRALIAETTRGFRPNQVVAVSADPGTSVVPLLADRIAIDGKPTAYVCRGFVCRLPVTTPEALRAELAAAAAVAASAAAAPAPDAPS